MGLTTRLRRILSALAVLILASPGPGDALRAQAGGEQAGHRILVVNPNTSAATTGRIAANARRAARPGTEIVAIDPDEGPELILGFFENQLATAELLRAVEARDPGSYDAIVVAAYSDAGLYGLRELVDVPVVGIAEASMLLAHPLGYRFTIVTFVDRLRPFLHELVRFHGFRDRLASIRIAEIAPGELRDEEGRPAPRLVEAARAAVEEDGAEVILLGGATLTGLDRVLAREIGVPVIDGVSAAVKVAEALLDYGLSTSKVGAFAPPASRR